MNRSEIKTRITKHLFEGGGLFIVAALLSFFAVSPRGLLFTEQFFDGIRITPAREEVVVLGIDDQSLLEKGAWPWDRTVFADLTNILSNHGAKMVIFDILFFEPRKGDSELKQAIQKSDTKVMFAGEIKGESYISSIFAKEEPALSAFSNMYPDSDGKIRRYPGGKIFSDTCVRGLGESAFRFFTRKDSSSCGHEADFHFRYAPSVTTYSISGVLSGQIGADKLKGKTIFIGATALGLGDNFIGMSGEKIPGVYVHASIFSSLMNKEEDRMVAPLLVACIILFCMLATLFLLQYSKKIFTQISSLVALSLTVFFVSYFSFEMHVILPLPWMLFGVILAGGYSVLVRYIREYHKNEFIESLFLRYVHKDVLRELIKSPGSLNLVGEKKYTTILFSDLRGFTSFSEHMQPEDLMQMLNKYFSAMTPILLEERGTVDKYIGDAIMAFWNAPLPVEHHETHAVRCALLMQNALKDFNAKHKVSLAMGIGIHSGDVIVGNVGSKERMNYTILGDVVNLASRIEGMTKKYGVQILVTEEVRGKVIDSSIIFRKIDVVTVAGKTVPTHLYEPAERTADSESLAKKYEEALSYYQDGAFVQALPLFEELALRGDAASSVMIERIKSIKEKDAWDGVWRWEKK